LAPVGSIYRAESDVLRISLPRTAVKKAIYSALPLRFCFNEFLDVSNAPLHQPANAFLHRLIDRHLGNDR
jgi:hypothetical protein